MKDLGVIHPWSLESLGAGLMTDMKSITGAASATYVAANRAHYIPFIVSEPMTVVYLFAYNGATASGNIDMGIYDAKGTRLVSIGSTVQTGTNVLQTFDIADTVLGPGRFYVAVAMDNATGTLFRSAVAVQLLSALGVCQQATAFALPATATFATMASTALPVIGLATRTTF